MVMLDSKLQDYQKEEAALEPNGQAAATAQS
jgi:hypothetical protein